MITAIFTNLKVISGIENLIGVNLEQKDFEAVVKFNKIYKDFVLKGYFYSNYGEVSQYRRITDIIHPEDFFSFEKTKNTFDLNFKFDYSSAFSSTDKRMLYAKKELYYLTETIRDELINDVSNTSVNMSARKILTNHSIEKIKSMIDVADILE